MADLIFSHPRLAEIYDSLEGDRRDLDAYVNLAEDFGARTILDIGCGTGNLACRLASLGYVVTGLDPAQASLDIARKKPFADQVSWILGESSLLPALAADVAFMTGNVAQVFIDDQDWLEVLSSANRALCRGGKLVFETRDPNRRAWVDWTREKTSTSIDLPQIGSVEAWCELIEVVGDLVSFRWTHLFHTDGACLNSDSTLRFRSLDTLVGSLEDSGFRIDSIGDAPDRPGCEFVFIATAV